MFVGAKATFRPRSYNGRFVDAVITPAVRASVEAAATVIQAAAQGYAPVRTGALRESITMTIDDQGTTIIGRVAATAPYAVYVEYGTGQRGAESPGAGPGPYSEHWKGMSAQPYMRPALDETKPSILDLFRSNIQAVLA